MKRMLTLTILMVISFIFSFFISFEKAPAAPVVAEIE